MSKQKIALFIALGALIIPLIIIFFPAKLPTLKTDIKMRAATYAYSDDDVISCYQNCIDDYAYYAECLEKRLSHIKSSILYTEDTYDDLWDTINEISDETHDTCESVSIFSCRCM